MLALGLQPRCKLTGWIRSFNWKLHAHYQGSVYDSVCLHLTDFFFPRLIALPSSALTGFQQANSFPSLHSLHMIIVQKGSGTNFLKTVTVNLKAWYRVQFVQLTLKIHVSTDDYYAFTNIPNIPTRIPLSDFSENSDLLKDLLRPLGNEEGGCRTAPVVELSSAKSGFKLVFDTNRKFLFFFSFNIFFHY